MTETTGKTDGKKGKPYKFVVPYKIEKVYSPSEIPEELGPDVLKDYLGVFKATLSTSGLDRENDIVTWKAIEKGAGQLDEHGIVLYNHDNWTHLPIGRFLKAWAVKREPDERGIEGGDMYGFVGISKTASDIWTLIDERILREMSVGGYLNEAKEFYDDDGNLEYRTINDWDLYEASVVNIAANPEAKISLILGKMLGDLESDRIGEEDLSKTNESDPPAGGDEDPDLFSQIQGPLEEAINEAVATMKEEIATELEAKIEEASSKADEDLSQLREEATEGVETLTDQVVTLADLLLTERDIEIEDEDDEEDDDEGSPEDNDDSEE